MPQPMWTKFLAVGGCATVSCEQVRERRAPTARIFCGISFLLDTGKPVAGRSPDAMAGEQNFRSQSRTSGKMFRLVLSLKSISSSSVSHPEAPHLHQRGVGSHLQWTGGVSLHSVAQRPCLRHLLPCIWLWKGGRSAIYSDSGSTVVREDLHMQRTLRGRVAHPPVFL